MKTTQTYFILSGLFLAAFLLVEYTDIYGDPGWFKAFNLILTASFLLGGITGRRKSKDKDSGDNYNK